MKKLSDELIAKRNIVFRNFISSLTCIPVYVIMYVFTLALTQHTHTRVSLLGICATSLILGGFNLVGTVFVFLKEFPWVRYD